MKTKKILALLLCLMMAAALCFTAAGCAEDDPTPETEAQQTSQKSDSSGTGSEAASGTDSSAGEKNQTAKATIACTGDILLHSPFLGDSNNDGTVDDPASCVYYDKTKKDFDYTPIFQYVKSYYEKADYTIANLVLSAQENSRYDFVVIN